jgi:taurine dioxygenase
MQIRRLSAALGAEVTGLDVRRMTDAEFDTVHAAFLDHLMLVFRSQELQPEDQLSFGRRWGEIAVTPMLKYVENHPGLLPVHNLTKAGAFTENWHYDSAFMEAPHALSILAPLVLPPIGGDTMWSNQYLAYDSLSDGVKRMIEGVRIKFSGEVLARYSGANQAPEGHYHPVVRTHPESGRKALYLGKPGGAVFEDMTPAETFPLLDFLYRHSTQPDNIYRHRWEAGDVVVWDNRCTMHYAVHDYGDAVRDLHRCTIKGTVPV